VRAGPPRVFAVASEVPPSNKAAATAIRADLDMPFLQAASYVTGNDGNSDGSSVRISFTDSVSVSGGSGESKQAQHFGQSQMWQACLLLRYSDLTGAINWVSH
jgi:hypothetical protein